MKKIIEKGKNKKEIEFRNIKTQKYKKIAYNNIIYSF